MVAAVALLLTSFCWLTKYKVKGIAASRTKIAPSRINFFPLNIKVPPN